MADVLAAVEELRCLVRLADLGKVSGLVLTQSDCNLKVRLTWRLHKAAQPNRDNAP